MRLRPVEAVLAGAPAVRGEPPAEGMPEAPAPCTTIHVAVVRIEGGRIRGTLAPYAVRQPP